MTGILASRLGSHPVMTAAGEELGTLEGITMDPATGGLATLWVEPSGEPTDAFDRDDHGRLEVPADRVSGQGEYVAVDAP
jgi:sporulation protein YlmC with PRC-barrel domain